MNPEGSPPFSHKPATGTYLEPDEPNRHSHTVFP